MIIPYQIGSQVTESPQRRCLLSPPDPGSAFTVGVNDDFPGATAGPSYACRVRIAEVYPAFDFTGETSLPQIGFICRTDSAPEFEPVAGVQCKHQQSQHHALVGFRGMAGDRQVEVTVDLSVHVRDIDGCLEDSGFERHGVLPCRCPGGPIRLPGRRSVPAREDAGNPFAAGTEGPLCIQN